jgi:hypothetical protein
LFVSTALQSSTNGADLKSISVLHINHWKDGKAGKYFYLDCNVSKSFLRENSVICEPISGTTNCKIPTLYQYRNGKLVYYGPITMSEETSDNGGCHGRRTALASVRDWQPNDLIYAAAIGAYFKSLSVMNEFAW